MAKKAKSAAKSNQTAPYKHLEAKSLMRPEVGTQAQFKKKKSPKTYRYDSSLSPALDWDAKNPAREQGETLIKQVLDAKSLEEAKAAASKLKSLSKPFLNWAGKAERLSFDVPTLPLFIHERLSTKAIIETLAGHKTDKQEDMFALFGDPQHSITDQVLKSYEYQDNWTNRMVLGDSLVVMNSLLRYEGLGGQVQMIYMDPPYGVKFGSNFQPFVRKRDVSHNDDEDMTREPEMVQAYRDTWELGLHSYLTYLRDRLLLARDLLTPSGSIFVQISDENLHHVREVMDEVFGAENFVSLISVRKTGGATSETVPTVVDYLLWYAKDRTVIKYRPLFVPKVLGEEGATEYTNVELSDGTIRSASEDEILGRQSLPEHARIFATDSAVSEGFRTNTSVPFSWKGITFDPGRTKNWKTSIEGMLRLCELGRILPKQGFRIYKRYFADFPFRALSNVWMDVRGALDRLYVVQTDKNVVERCLLMTTDPGDLVLDPTCGSGTTAYVAEQWGRRWITADTSRVPLALARQRLLTATFPWYELKDQHRGPAGGFAYKRKQNKKGEEVGGIVPHVTLKSIANNEPPAEEVLVDRPEVENGITRVTGPFCVEATIPTPVDWEGDGVKDSGTVSAEAYGSFVDRMLEVLRKSPVLRLEGNKAVTFKNVRPPAKSLSLSAEALVVNGQEKAVALVFGPENGAVSEKLVYEAAKEANGKSYTHLYVIGFAIQPNARTLVEKCAEVMGVPATYVQATPDLMMGDLLKNMRSSQIFSVCGQPEIKVSRNKEKQYQVELLGLDVFDPITMEVTHRSGDDVPAWLLDTDYNNLCFHVSQAFFPRTSAWDNLKKALKGEYEESVWDHLSGTTSAPFEAGEHKQIAVKVIDDRGNELLVVKKLNENSR
ncbi:MAG: site-specific DNA-methyltransferase [Nitrospiraceae bacterium]|jgi:adenine-specific DNA-methyltransferase|uniref:site-specific DNA-methyltransferase n=1 Tax=Nitrospira cf. moscoviensis SBR1015 TaxID=96242 RepID=UPI000A0E001C|nr:site-specific DNA-methyltransferase [Nitrospira cf. moscoviensis SBR1015]MBY0247622.1 site-specific DNA-methyltransferase [Nitrospiraceae bacterium]OQW30638.1 MAG: DNA methylase [Nitrospira sp. SG-bin2]